mgnify:CR=1 FL=1
MSALVWKQVGVVTPSDTKNAANELLVEGLYVGTGGNITFQTRDAPDADVAATATVAITNYANIVAGTHTIALVASDGTAITATAHASTTTSSDTNSPTFAIGSDNLATATNLATCLNANSKLSASVTYQGNSSGSGPGGAEITITQATAGSAGNTDITVTDPGDSGISAKDFTGGATSLTTLTGLNAGQIVQIDLKYVMSTGTTATNLAWLAINGPRNRSIQFNNKGYNPGVVYL